jgi:hypothetical protein
MSALPSGWAVYITEPRAEILDANAERERCNRWKADFVVELLALCPELNPDAADEASDAAVNNGLTPRLAAEQWAERQGPLPPANIF